ncbi:MFS transporter [Alloscardovia omnicolens]|uniref:MFS transporter n=1 Tax=Alloscardovia omnicolens TaxID=419015 RepID=A0A2I1M5C0_9BIFI|nr:MFS transporter [Alloscardovia omnicolens]PKZ15321.1 MFS transporter [Alloscardovia omnicolens]
MSQSTKKVSAGMFVPIFVTFFTMGFVDFVGTATNFVKEDMALQSWQASLFTTMVFFWFFIFAIPTSYCMNKYGRRITVLISIAITIGACVFPIFAYGIPNVPKSGKLVLMVISFILLGVGNTFMQVSLNPLIANLVSDERYSSTISAGQFVKAISSFSAPLVAAWLGSAFGMWWFMYVIFLVFSVVAYISLSADKIEEEKRTASNMSFGKVLALLGDPIILLCFIGIMCHVGMDAGVNTYAPQFLIGAHAGLTASAAAYTTSIYFAFRTLGFAVGMWALMKFANKVSVAVCSACIALSVVCFLLYTTVAPQDWVLYAALAFIGFGNSNVFSLMFSIAGLHIPERQNEISGLMIMGLIGGAILPPVMGAVSGAVGNQLGSALVLVVPACYLIFLATQPKRLGEE